MGEVKDRQWSIVTNLNKFFKTRLRLLSCRFASHSISSDADRKVNEKSLFSDFCLNYRMKTVIKVPFTDDASSSTRE